MFWIALYALTFTLVRGLIFVGVVVLIILLLVQALFGLIGGL
jgi:uncharacterized MAPEG superfamily protein